MKRIPVLTLSLASLAIASHLLPAAAGWLEFSRDALDRGALWRLATGHLTHFNAEHLQWDVVVFLLLGSIMECWCRRSFAAILGLAAIAVSLAVWLLQPQFATYRGLSGLDSALFGGLVGRLTIHGWRKRDPLSVLISVIALTGFGAKCAYEIATQSTVFVTTAGFTPVPLAHAVGAATGLLVALASVRIRESAIDQLLEIPRPDRQDGAVDPQLLDQRCVSKRV